MLNQLGELIQDIAETGQPSLALLVNILILGLVVMYVIWRVKSELRGIQWNNLTFQERRAIIERLLVEAIETAEWLHSNLEMPTPDAKRKVATKKRRAALRYTEMELRAMGAASQDMHTLKLRLEQVLAAQNAGKMRFGSVTAPQVTVS